MVSGFKIVSVRFSPQQEVDPAHVLRCAKNKLKEAKEVIERIAAEGTPERREVVRAAEVVDDVKVCEIVHGRVQSTLLNVVNNASALADGVVKKDKEEEKAEIAATLLTLAGSLV